jgi:L-glyceraldehyde 3-phosphate reductase
VKKISRAVAITFSPSAARRLPGARFQKVVYFLATAWVLRWPQVTSALIGASKPQQIIDVVGTLDHLDLSQDDLNKIEEILQS